MFNQIKDLYQLQSRAKELKNVLAGKQVTGESNGVIITMNGSQEIINLKLNPELDIANQEQNLIKAFNDVSGKVQRLMAEEMMRM
ncbi:MAG TPA: YbaB/EbfC family nucleoid-associated protein [bacterium]|nr:YbaB/EbfC family nucleoid-associated protein [bacterium]HPL95211.1 YbaB/EbfC family nucleoid-associated protein [bacterium]